MTGGGCDVFDFVVGGTSCFTTFSSSRHGLGTRMLGC